MAQVSKTDQQDRWHTSDQEQDVCADCGGGTEIYLDDTDLCLAQRCTRCRWQVNYDRDAPRSVPYGTPVEAQR